MEDNKLILTKLHKDFVNSEKEYERYAMTHWKNISKILWKNNEGKNKDKNIDKEIDDIECIVKISVGKKCVYRKLRSSNKFKEDEIGLGYRSALALGIKQNNNDKVTIRKSCWLPYLWHHIDSTIKWPFRFAAVTLLPSIISSLITISELIINILK